MELQDYIRILRAHWRGVAALTLAGLILAIGYNFTQPKIYAANASGFVSTGTSDNPAVSSVGDTLAKSRATSYIQLATSRKVAQIVIDKLGLATTPDGLIGQISVVQPPDTVTLQITAKAKSPAEAQELADAWVQALSQAVDDLENPNHSPDMQTMRVVPVVSAALPTAPISPRTRVNMMIGLAAGFALGLGYALVRNMLDRRLRDAEQVERTFKVPVVGGVPDDKYFAHESNERGPLAVLDGGSGSGRVVAESFRKMRTNLSYMDVDNPPRVIVVTSPRPDDGKSTVAANLAAAVASSGSETLLLDGDLRRPTVTTYMGAVAGAGLTDVLVGAAMPADVMQESRLPQLKVMGAGQVPPNPSELLGSQAMRNLLTALAKDYIVIIDAPPLLPVTDAAILTRHAHGALIVIKSGKTLDHELATALANIEAVKGRTLGVVLNRIRRGSNNKYLYDSYYGQDTAPKRSKAARDKPIKPVKVSGGKRSK